MRTLSTPSSGRWEASAHASSAYTSQYTNHTSLAVYVNAGDHWNGYDDAEQRALHQLPMLGAASPPLSERNPLSEQQHRTHPNWWGTDAYASHFWKRTANEGMSALSAMLPSWSTVLLVLLIGILLLSYWVVRGVSVETLLASYRLVNQGKATCIQRITTELLA